MKKILLFINLMLCFQVVLIAQTLKSPSEFLNYKLGEQFTPHHQVLDYYQYLAKASPLVKLQEYGKTYENRPLMLAYVGSERNISRLEEIRKSNLQLAGMAASQDALSDQPVIVWLSYNVHGNESVSTEASMQTIFDLLDPQKSTSKAWLENTLIIIDPCINPDGRERYVNFYNPIKNKVPDASPYSREHLEPWPGGRSNHYYFDLNRDWAWQSQIETQKRMQVYNKWLPQVHVDFHEQGVNEPYYFAPAAEPYHQDISKWQRDFQIMIGRNNARYFDERGWMYFTRERFDLLYPSYGDTYPTYNGSVGMTYEQGGGGRAGLAIIDAEGDTLTLKDRIDHHLTTGLSTIEVASANASKALAEFEDYFTKGKNAPPGEYKTYVIKAGNIEKLRSLASLLDKNGIEYGYGLSKSAKGFNYLNSRVENFQVTPEDMVISAYQPKSVLLKVLFEPVTYVADSVTYDITAWSLPYAHGIPAYASTERMNPVSTGLYKPAIQSTPTNSALAYIVEWNSLADVKFLSALLKEDIRVRYSEIPFESGRKKFNAGSLIIARSGNGFLGGGFDRRINAIAEQSGVQLTALSSGFVENGADLGSDRIRYIQKPRVVAIAGDGISSLAIGEVWHFFEQELAYPLSVIRSSDLNRIDWSEMDVLILPDGNYPDIGNEKMMEWIRSGGKIIAMERAVAQIAGKAGFNLKKKEEPKVDEKKVDPYENIRSYETRERESIAGNIPGAIYKVQLDNSHPLAFGFPSYYFTLKLDDSIYPYMSNGWNVGVLKKDNYVTGFAGSQVKKKLIDGMLFGTESIGAGTVVYLSDDPLFRSFWENGKLMFSNAVFMVGQ